MRTPVSASVLCSLDPFVVNGGEKVYSVQQANKLLVVEYVAGYIENAAGASPGINLFIFKNTQTVESAGEWPIEIAPNNLFQQQTLIFVRPQHDLYMHVTRQTQSSSPTRYRLSIAGHLIDA